MRLSPESVHSWLAALYRGRKDHPFVGSGRLQCVAQMDASNDWGNDHDGDEFASKGQQGGGSRDERGGADCGRTDCGGAAVGEERICARSAGGAPAIFLLVERRSPAKFRQGESRWK